MLLLSFLSYENDGKVHVQRKNEFKIMLETREITMNESEEIEELKKGCET